MLLPSLNSAGGPELTQPPFTECAESRGVNYSPGCDGTLYSVECVQGKTERVSRRRSPELEVRHEQTSP